MRNERLAKKGGEEKAVLREGGEDFGFLGSALGKEGLEQSIEGGEEEQNAGAAEKAELEAEVVR